MRCWGYNFAGQLGYGHTSNIGDNEAPAAAGDVEVGGVVMQLVAGVYHTCALMESGAVRCWGHNQYGQLGYGHTDFIGNDEVPSSAGDVPINDRGSMVARGLPRRARRLVLSAQPARAGWLGGCGTVHGALPRSGRAHRDP